MLETSVGGIRCKISLLFPAVLLCLLLIDRTGLAAFGFSAAILHECGHVAALMLWREKPLSLTVSFFGMRMELKPRLRSLRQELLLYAGGPLMNGMCAAVLYAAKMPSVFVWMHGLLAVWNLFPLLPLDGGQMLHCVLTACVSPQTVSRWMAGVFWVMTVPLAALSLLLWYHAGNFTLLIVVGYLVSLKLFYKGN